MKIAAFGEVLWDNVEGEYHLGGAPLNFTAHAVQCGLPAAIISAYGADELGEKAKVEIEALKVDTAFLQVSDKDTGTVQVTLHNGQPEYNITKEVAYDYILTHKIDFELLNQYDSFYFGTLAQRNPVSQACLKMIFERCSFEMVFLDVNLRQSFYTLKILFDSIKQCTVLKLNDDEVAVLSELLFECHLSLETFSKKLIDQFSNIKTLIITKGAKGCLVYESKEFIHISSTPVEVADTIGAGDSFSAAFCAFYLRTNDVKAAAKLANKIGGFVASQHGAIPIYNIQKFL